MDICPKLNTKSHINICMRFFVFLKKIIKSLTIPFLLFKKPIFKKVLIFLSAVCLVAFLLLTPYFIFNKNNFMLDVSPLLSNSASNKQVLSLWHIETFEGGSANRAKYLEKVAQEFNKTQKNCFIIVKTLTENQLFLNLEQKQYADIYSFGVGSGYMLSGFLQALENNNEIREDLQNYSMLNKNILAYPYMFGAYFAITRQTDMQFQPNQASKGNKTKQLCFGNNSFINPLEALNKCSYQKFNKEDCIYDITSYQAYCDFIEHKSKTLIGTSRDYASVKNRESLGTISSCDYKCLAGYTDLVQYIGINKSVNTLKKSLAQSFCRFLTSETSQKLLRNYGLFSSLNTKIYEKNEYSNFENILLNSTLNSINVFESVSSINNQKEKSFNNYFN